MNKKVNITTGTDASEINEALSTSLKQYRSQKKMSLDELSRLAGVSKGMLVEIEACRANPSIAILCKLAAAMGVSVADIVNVASKPNAHLIASEDIPCLWKGDNGGTARLLAGTSGPEMIELWEWKMYPGEIFDSPGHSDGTCELIHVVKGALLLTLGEEHHNVKEGCSVIARTDLPHSYGCVGSDLLRFTMTVSEKIR
ncbi:MULTISPECIES: helix-turn-helix transcriptional regulator [unclassified Pantoea]|uniref:helix-turn-helix transcriptional regulator n=1 Tax=unclassified Pantoea TaxID=2630326 RepID=UPI001CD3CCB6|nr:MULTISPECIES: helix-turn-helix transcriptional regulator [unclassified Pantoea]MCA1176691.1 helix-turn-helix transcriptional regulator [Pantoea sp. alder69]MCA1251604.1 helix-turn-helix transcriptional regulator [Pantoea sp. alder70]MCA1264265.1 helix-turn-helix transcriptional regulator [Pantoea sp. alder81]